MAGSVTDEESVAGPAYMSWSKVTSMNARGRAVTVPGGGLTAMTSGGTTGSSDVDLVRLADQQPAVGGGQEVEAAGAALRDRHLLERGDVNHRQVGGRGGDGAGRGVRGVVVRDEQEVVQRRALLAEGDRLDVRVEGAA